EFGIEAGQELLAQIAMGGGHGGDARQPEFVDETVLPRAVDPLAAAARLGRVAGGCARSRAGRGPGQPGWDGGDPARCRTWECGRPSARGRYRAPGAGRSA